MHMMYTQQQVKQHSRSKRSQMENSLDSIQVEQYPRKQWKPSKPESTSRWIYWDELVNKSREKCCRMLWGWRIYAGFDWWWGATVTSCAKLWHSLAPFTLSYSCENHSAIRVSGCGGKHGQGATAGERERRRGLRVSVLDLRGEMNGRAAGGICRQDTQAAINPLKVHYCVLVVTEWFKLNIDSMVAQQRPHWRLT